MQLGLDPTNQILRDAKDAGFKDVHDYLVHLVTGEDAETIFARKPCFPWGTWLKGNSGDMKSGESEEEDPYKNMSRKNRVLMQLGP